MMLGAVISPLYLCFGKVGWHCVCQPFLDTAVTFRALIRLLEWLSLRRLLPTWHILSDMRRWHAVRYKMLCRNLSVVVSVRKNVRLVRYRWKRDVRSGKWKNVKCVLDVFTDVRNLRSAMAMEKRTDMGSIKIRMQEFRRNYGKNTI